MMRNPESLIVTLGVPLGILVFFSVVDVLPTGSDPVVFLVPGVLAISAMATGLVVVAIQTAFERKYGVLKRLGVSPMTRMGFLVSKGLAVLGTLTIQVVLVFAVAWLGLGWRPHGSLVVAVGATLVGGFCFAALGLLMAGALKAELALALSNAVFGALLLVSGLVFDPDTLPSSVAALATMLPSGALGEVLRAALSNPGRLDLAALCVLVAWGVAATLAAARTFRWEP